MGLNFSPGNAHWSYSGFNRFRVKLAKEIGIDLSNMIGFGGEGSWEEVRDPIKPLLFHSDCDGKLTVSECMVIYPRLLELIEHWDDDDFDKEEGFTLANDMKYCAENKTPLIFC